MNHDEADKFKSERNQDRLLETEEIKMIKTIDGYVLANRSIEYGLVEIRASVSDSSHDLSLTAGGVSIGVGLYDVEQAIKQAKKERK